MQDIERTLIVFEDRIAVSSNWWEWVHLPKYTLTSIEELEDTKDYLQSIRKYNHIVDKTINGIPEELKIELEKWRTPLPVEIFKELGT